MAASEDCFVLGPLSLTSPSSKDVDNVCESLLDWPDCTECGRTGSCSISICPWSKKAGLQPYLQFYEEIACGSRPADPFEDPPALRNHDELLAIIRLIKRRPRCARRMLIQEHFITSGQPPSLDEQGRAFNVAIELLTMVKCSAECIEKKSLAGCSSSTIWKDEDSAIKFAQSAVQSGTPLNHDEIMLLLPSLTAQSLERHGLVLVRTSNILEHLLYNPKVKTVHIFHHARFLREALWSKHSEIPVDMAIFPRKLAFETLHVLQSVLFPWYDLPSRAIIKRDSFDPACLDVDTTHYSVHFGYWGVRMRILAGVLETARPANALSAWLQRRSRLQLAGFVIATFTAVVTLATFIVEVWKRREKDV